MSAPEQALQAGRLAAVKPAQLAPTASEEAFHRLTRLASVLLDAPLAFVTLVDATRAWYQSCVGLASRDEEFAPWRRRFAATSCRAGRR